MQKERLIQIFKDAKIENILIDEMMSQHTSFKIGGPVDILIVPEDEEEILKAIKTCRDNEIEPFIMGNGSNLLVRDGGIRGVVIKINDNFSHIEVKENKIYAQAGALLTAVSRRAMEGSLTGIEFANGIPGTIGGAVTMNAGAYGGEMKDVISKVRLIDKENNILEYSNEMMNFAYRNSKVKEEGLIIIGVELQLQKGKQDEIKTTMRDLTEKRTSKQPLKLPSGGSTFKRPEGYYAGKLIDEANFRGFKHGGAQISEKHCGFIVNVDNATCKDVLELIKIVQDRIRDKYKVELETEIKIIGED